jgi:nuclear pore complex protein Nup107
MDIEEVFSELAASKDIRIRNEAQQMAHKIQQYLILDQIGTLMDEMEQWIKLHTEQKMQSLRFLSHLVLFLRLIGRAEKDHIGDEVLRAYVKVIHFRGSIS